MRYVLGEGPTVMDAHEDKAMGVFQSVSEAHALTNRLNHDDLADLLARRGQYSDYQKAA